MFLTDALKWEFVRVDRVPCGGMGGGAAAADAAAAGGSDAGAASAGSLYSFTRVRVIAHASLSVIPTQLVRPASWCVRRGLSNWEGKQLLCNCVATVLGLFNASLFLNVPFQSTV